MATIGLDKLYYATITEDPANSLQSFLSYLYSTTCSRLIRGHYQEGYTHHYKRLS